MVEYGVFCKLINEWEVTKNVANTPSAIKRVRTSEKRRLYNRSIKSAVRTMVRRFDEAVASGEASAANERFVKAASALDRAVSKGVLHKNTAARKKSRMASRLTSLSAE